LPVRVLSRLFRRLFLERLHQAHRDGQLQFFGHLAALASAASFTQYLAPLAQKDWYVYAKQPFAGPHAVLAYLSRYTHRVAISNHRLIAHDERGVTFAWKDYRTKRCVRDKPMTLSTDELHWARTARLSSKPLRLSLRRRLCVEPVAARCTSSRYSAQGCAHHHEPRWR
jgi:hypothetical protein